MAFNIYLVPVKLYFAYILPVVLFIIFIPGWVFVIPKKNAKGVEDNDAWPRFVVGVYHAVLFLVIHMIFAFMASKIPW